jgi:hypothetical protein
MAIRRTHEAGCFWPSVVVIIITVYLFIRLVFWFYDRALLDAPQPAPKASPTAPPAPPDAPHPYKGGIRRVAPI